MFAQFSTNKIKIMFQGWIFYVCALLYSYKLLAPWWEAMGYCYSYLIINADLATFLAFL